MKLIIWTALFALIMLDPAYLVRAQTFDPQEMIQVDFFKDSIRRDLLPNETSSMLRLAYFPIKNEAGSYCTAFSIKNSMGQFFVATARHCVSYKAKEACDKKQFTVSPIKGFPFTFAAQCKRLVAANVEDDLFIVEMEIFTAKGNPHPQAELIKLRLNSFSLGAYDPPNWFGVKMIGHPSDTIRGGRPTVSENCKIVPNSLPSTWDSLSETEKVEANKANERVTAAKKAEDLKYAESKAQQQNIARPAVIEDMRQKINITSGKFNCSVYAGNSGGPIILQNTNDVVGLPFGYFPDLYKEIPEGYGQDIELTAGFVKRNRKALDENKVSISANIARIAPNFEYLKLFSTVKTYSSTKESCTRVKLRTERKQGIVVVSFIQSCDRKLYDIPFQCENQSGIQFCMFKEDDGKVWYIDSVSATEFRLWCPNSDYNQTYKIVNDI